LRTVLGQTIPADNLEIFLNMTLQTCAKVAAGILASIFVATLATRADPLAITVARPAPPSTGGFKMGSSRRLDGAALTLDSSSLILNGKPWTPVMGEFHFSRYPANEWREELLKMKAGGIDAVATYVFWIHHEEIEGQFDWSGRRDLRRFVQLCGEVGLKTLVRCGPWDHGEVRNGGFPDWLQQKPWKLRSNDSNYLAQAKILYDQIAKQLNGLLWKDGGPVIGIQLENEYWGPAEHLLTLKRLAREAGLDVPIYTKTGWPLLATPLPFGEMVPLYGVYAEGFWDRELTPMPDSYWRGFYFSKLRTDDAIDLDLLGHREAKDPPEVEKYPYLTCEIGAGMMPSYHRRILFYPMDALSTALVKLGSGGSSLGYYMYHGGENPDGKLSTLEESQASGGWSDLPVKNYDFHTALGQYGQIRPQYHLLRRLHLFLRQWGSTLAGMPATMPDQRPDGRTDVGTLRWCVRSDGTNGFVFVNNYQRLQEMPPSTNVQFKINLASGPVIFPEQPVTIPSNACFFWPFNLDLGRGVRLAYATAQPVAAIDDGNVRTVFFSETKNIPAQFAFDNRSGMKVVVGRATSTGGRTIVRDVKPGAGAAMQIKTASGMLQIVLLTDAQSLAFWKGSWHGRDRVFLTTAGLVCDGDNLRLTSTNRADLKVAVYPAPETVTINGEKLHGKSEGVFESFTSPAQVPVAFKLTLEKIQSAGQPREVPLGKIKQPVAAEPEDADFSRAAIWRIKLPANIDLQTDPILRLHYVGDVARLMLDGKLLTDDFYNGNTFEIGLRRYAPDILKGDLRVAILPLRKDAPILLAKEAKPDFGTKESVVSLDQVEMTPHYQAQLTIP
jgi:beta-galactosidase